MRIEIETRLTAPCGMRVCFTRRLVWKEIFSVLRLTPFEPEDVVFGGRGRFAAVPGDPALSVEPVLSSVFCEVSITDLLWCTFSSLCSPLVKSQATETPARNFSEPRRGSRVALILAR